MHAEAKLIMNKLHHKLTIPVDMLGLRLDQALVKLLPDYSRTQIQEWIKDSAVTVNGQIIKTRIRMKGGEKIDIQSISKPPLSWEAQAIPLNIIYEDDELLVINKPSGLVVHPAAGHQDQTLLNALLYHNPRSKDLPRAGIVHRLDKDTSGLLVVAKTKLTLISLYKQLKKRTISREYQSIVVGNLISGGTIDEPIARHPVHRKRMAVITNGRPAITHYRVIEKYRHHTRLKVQLETGRTHQIRVHMAYIRHPVVGDATYGGRLFIPQGATPALRQALQQFRRQALHAYALGCTHPVTQEFMRWEVDLPADMQELIKHLKQDSASGILGE
ncbi:MAG: RNA pseudouridine synthase [Gammaproteobacteria bacterium RIFCSPHIGHO2_12_FULL_41_20]|nr:MAG: RNA pseudouridine synthase [Gammaproteobacteria bacterium RIFCSPHIGHO2_12_FULL_41_20]